MKRDTTKGIFVLVVLIAIWSLGLAAQQTVPGKTQSHYIVKALSTLGGTQSGANSINNKGWLTGWATFPGDLSEHGVLWRGQDMVDLGTLGGPDSAVAFPVKDDIGVVVGNSLTSEIDPLDENFCGGTLDTVRICLGFRWQNGRISALPPLGGNNSFATDANNRGQIAGFAETATRNPNCIAPQVFDFEGVIWGPQEGQIQELPPYPGDAIGAAFGINDKGQAVGGSGICGPFNPFFFTHAVLWQNGSVRNLGSLGGQVNLAFLINNRGEVVGASDLAGGTAYHAFLWTEEHGMQDLGTVPGDSVSGAESVNEEGQVVGLSCDQNGNCRAALWQDGVMTDPNSLVLPGSSLYLVNASDINDRGEIAGNAYDPSTGDSPGFLAIPCDEEHADVEGCKDQADGTSVTLAGAGERPTVILPENVREQLRRGRGFGGFGARVSEMQ